MRFLRMGLLSVVMMAAGAGLLAAAQHARVQPRPEQRPDRDEHAAPVGVGTRPVVVVADSAAMSERMAGIEAKLETLARHAAREEPGDESLTTPPDTRAPEEQQSMDEASRIVDAALGRGQWLSGDQSRMREVTAQLLPADYFALKMKLAAAANQGKLKDFAARPFFF